MMDSRNSSERERIKRTQEYTTSMGMPEFCDMHGNLKISCHLCKPKEKLVVHISGITCPVYSNKNIPDEICTNAGSIMVDITSRTETYQCTSCGWEFTNKSTNFPRWVICDCGNSEVMKTKFGEEPKMCTRCASKRYKCARCGNARARCSCPAKSNNN